MTSLSKPISHAEERRDKLAMRKQIERAVYRAVDARDGRKCRACGRKADPQAVGIIEHGHHHHVTFRSAGGGTTTANVCLLCGACHADVHAHRLTIEGDANKPLKIRRVE